MQSEGTYIEIDGPPTFKANDSIVIGVDYGGDGSVYVHLTGPYGHDGTIELSTADARLLARQLKRLAVGCVHP